MLSRAGLSAFGFAALAAFLLAGFAAFFAVLAAFLALGAAAFLLAPFFEAGFAGGLGAPCSAGVAVRGRFRREGYVLLGDRAGFLVGFRARDGGRFVGEGGFLGGLFAGFHLSSS